MAVYRAPVLPTKSLWTLTESTECVAAVTAIICSQRLTTDAIASTPKVLVQTASGWTGTQTATECADDLLVRRTSTTDDTFTGDPIRALREAVTSPSPWDRASEEAIF